LQSAKVITNVSKLTEQYKAKLAEGQALVERSEWDDDSRAQRDAITAELTVLRADVDAEQALVQRSNEFASMATGGFAPIQFGADTSNVGFLEVVRAIYADDQEVLRAIQPTNTSNIAGLLDPAVYGNIVSLASVNSKIWDSFDKYPLTSQGLSFPRAYESNIVGASVVSENAEVTSATLNVVERTVNIDEVAIGFKLSKLAINRSDPQLMAIAQKQLANGLARARDAYAVAALVTASSNTSTLTATADYPTFRKAVVAARMAIEDRTGFEANRLYLASDRYQYLMGLADSAGRVQLPAEGNVNTDGSGSMFGSLNIGGAEIVYSPKLPSGYWAVAASPLLEAYQADSGFMQTEYADTRNVTISLGNYLATCLWAQGIQKFV
jgi:hypothetical protein